MIQENNLFCKKYLKPNNQETLQEFSEIQERIRLGGFEGSRVEVLSKTFK